jgi:hypothetical protein
MIQSSGNSSSNGTEGVSSPTLRSEESLDQTTRFIKNDSKQQNLDGCIDLSKKKLYKQNESIQRSEVNMKVHSQENESLLKLEVFTENIGGILYYIDKYNNVYKNEDIMNNIKNPRIIAKYIPSETSKSQFEDIHKVLLFL